MGRLLSTQQLAQKFSVREYQIDWLVRTKRVAPPVVGGVRLWRPEDVSAVRTIFAARERKAAARG